MRWVYLIAGTYFLLVIMFLSFGFGKIIYLMVGVDSWGYFKDIVEMCSWVSAVCGLYLAIKTYKDSESEKRLLRAEDALNEFKQFFLESSSIIEKRSEIIGSYHKFRERLKFISQSDANDLELALKNFSKTELKRIRLNRIFEIDPKYADIGTWGSNCSPEQFKEDVLPGVGLALFKSNLLVGSMLNIQGSAFDVLSILISCANKDAYFEYTYVDRNGERWWKNQANYPSFPENQKLNGDQDVFSLIHFEVIPAAVLYFYSFGRDKQKIIDDIKKSN